MSILGKLSWHCTAYFSLRGWVKLRALCKRQPTRKQGHATSLNLRVKFASLLLLSLRHFPREHDKSKSTLTCEWCSETWIYNHKTETTDISKHCINMFASCMNRASVVFTAYAFLTSHGSQFWREFEKKAHNSYSTIPSGLNSVKVPLHLWNPQINS